MSPQSGACLAQADVLEVCIAAVTSKLLFPGPPRREGPHIGKTNASQQLHTSSPGAYSLDTDTKDHDTTIQSLVLACGNCMVALPCLGTQIGLTSRPPAALPPGGRPLCKPGRRVTLGRLCGAGLGDRVCVGGTGEALEDPSTGVAACLHPSEMRGS